MSNSTVAGAEVSRAPWVRTSATAVKIALCYAVVGGLWILCSGWVLHLAMHDKPDLEALLETVKGWFFVLVTAFLLGAALARYFREIRRSAELLCADIAQRERAEQKLREYEMAMEGLQEMIAVLDRDYRYLLVNRAFLKFRGLARDQVEGRLASEVLPREAFDHVVKPKLDECLGGQVIQYEMKLPIPHRGERELSVSYFPVEAGGKIDRVACILEDITDRKHLESQLRQAQKLEAIGQLAGGVAHDFNNILAAIMMHLGLLQMNPDLDGETRHALQDLEAQARRAASLTRQLLMFSRRSVLSVKPLDLNEVVANLLKMLRRLIGEHIDLRFDGKSALPLVEADAGMMDQVLLNLAVNARDAMPKGGRITISTTLAHMDAPQAAESANRRVGDFVCLGVSDTGCGMDAATLKRIFEPFFTTKEAGHGTGLGLATVHGIVAQHKGWVEVDSEAGAGTTFRVYLPASAKAQEAVEPPPEANGARRGVETILLVEDDLQVRQLFGQALRTLGYQVYEVGNGQEAMTLWQERGSQVDLLLTDMVMPEGMTGLELAEQLQALKPGLQAIISSGYSAEIVNSGTPARAGLVYLPKPFTTEVLAGAIRGCLDQKQRPTS